MTWFSKFFHNPQAKKAFQNFMQDTASDAHLSFNRWMKFRKPSSGLSQNLTVSSSDNNIRLDLSKDYERDNVWLINNLNSENYNQSSPSLLSFENKVVENNNFDINQNFDDINSKIEHKFQHHFDNPSDLEYIQNNAEQFMYSEGDYRPISHRKIVLKPELNDEQKDTLNTSQNVISENTQHVDASSNLHSGSIVPDLQDNDIDKDYIDMISPSGINDNTMSFYSGNKTPQSIRSSSETVSRNEISEIDEQSNEKTKTVDCPEKDDVSTTTIDHIVDQLLSKNLYLSMGNFMLFFLAMKNSDTFFWLSLFLLINSNIFFNKFIFRSIKSFFIVRNLAWFITALIGAKFFLFTWDKFIILHKLKERKFGKNISDNSTEDELKYNVWAAGTFASLLSEQFLSQIEHMMRTVTKIQNEYIRDLCFEKPKYLIFENDISDYYIDASLLNL